MILVALWTAGCGAQRGKYANSGNRESAILPDAGLILIARGAALRHSVIAGQEQNLLYVLVVCPGVKGELTGTRGGIGPSSSDYAYTWSTAAGEISVAFTWDRERDVVRMADTDHQRSKGDAFVLRRDPGSGRWTAQQLAGIGDQLRPAEALQQIQSQLPTDPVISALMIYPGI